MNITDGLDIADMSQISSVMGFEDHCSVEAIADAFSSKFNSFTFSEMEVTEVESTLKDLNQKKSTGWDFIPPKCGATQLTLPLLLCLILVLESVNGHLIGKGRMGADLKERRSFG